MEQSDVDNLGALLESWERRRGAWRAGRLRNVQSYLDQLVVDIPAIRKRSAADGRQTARRFNALLETWEQRRSARRDGRLKSLIAYLAQLDVDIPAIRQEVAAEERRTASRFNIFRLLGVTRDEEKTHSAFLANLLNPAGSHGQQHLFLDSFLHMCAQKAMCGSRKVARFPLPEGNIQTGRWIIRKERWIVAGKSRADIIIRNPKLSYLLVIENKIDADERTDQLLRYGRWLDSARDPYTKRALIYLTRDGRPARTAGDYPYYRLSYWDDIHDWLDELLENDRVEAVWFREILKQYREIVKRL